MFRVDPIKLAASQAAKKTVKTASGEVFTVPQDARASQAQAAQSTGQLSNMSAMNALLFQEVEDPLERKKRHAKRGNDVLSALEAIKADVLVGDVSEASLLHLKDQLTTMRSEAVEGDTHLASILDEIEVRASVELAKRGLM